MEMYYQEKKTIATLIAGVMLLAAYCIYVFQKYQSGVIDMANDLKFWASTMLIFMGAGIVITIIILIVFHIINAIMTEVSKGEQEDPLVEDEMDKLIQLKATRNSYIVVGVGFVFSLVSLVMQMPLAIMINTIFLSFLLGSIFEGFSQLFYYRSGIKNG